MSVLLFSHTKDTKKFYEKVKEDLTQFYSKKNFKEKFLKEFDEFLDQLKTKAKKQNKKLSEFQTKTEYFFNEKIEKYKKKIHKINQDFKKEFHLREFDKFKKELYNKILNLKYSQKQRY